MTSISCGTYRILERIGSGGMAEVYRARASGGSASSGLSAEHDQLVALKRIHSDLARDAVFASLFADEARIAAHLDHRNIAKILDFGTIEGQPFLAFEHVHGRDLRALCRRHRVAGTTIPLAQACYIVLEACRGLAHAHERCDASGVPLRIVHRDISPQNLLLSFHGELEIIDFGIAKATCREATTERGWIKGKMRYMSPEQMGGGPVDWRSDLFSLGVVFFELLTGRCLFDTDNTLEIIRMVRSSQVPRPSDFEPSLPREIDDIVLGLLRERPEDRFQSAYELAAVLTEFVQRHELHTTRNRVAEWMKALYCVEYAVERARIAALWADAENLADSQPERFELLHADSAPCLDVHGQDPSDRRSLESTLPLGSGTLIGWAPAPRLPRPAMLASSSSVCLPAIGEDGDQGDDGDDDDDERTELSPAPWEDATEPFDLLPA